MLVGKGDELDSRLHLLKLGILMHQGGVLKMTQSGYTIQNIHAYSNLYRDEQRQNRILQDVSFFSVFGQNAEEFYEYWGMMTAALSLLIIVLVEVVPIIISFVRFLITLIL